MEIFFQLETYIALLTLTVIEIILGIDNIIFISIITNKVKKESRNQARVTGLLLALILRIIMLFGLTWFIGLTKPIFYNYSVKDLILLIGGGFLIFKSVLEISHKINGNFDEKIIDTKSVTLRSIIWQIVAIDFVFSVDSILTAIGLTEVLLIMVIAVVISIVFMIIYSSKISDIIDILVNNAGTNRPDHFTKIKKEDMDYVVDLNIKAAFHVAQMATKVMLNSKNRKFYSFISLYIDFLSP